MCIRVRIVGSKSLRLWLANRLVKLLSKDNILAKNVNSFIAYYHNYLSLQKTESLARPLLEFLENLDIDKIPDIINNIKEQNIKWLMRAPRKIDSIKFIINGVSRDASAGPRQIIQLAKFLKLKVADIYFSVFTNDRESLQNSIDVIKNDEILRDSKVFHIESVKDLDSLPHSSIAIATYWTTAYPLLFISDVDAKFYFIQDEEGYFYPANLERYFAELTYKFGYIGITNDVTLQKFYSNYMPCFRIPLFFIRGKRKNPNELQAIRKVFAYFRFSPRHSSELIYNVSKKLISELPDATIYLAGGHIFEDVERIVSLGWLSTEDLIKLYNESDLCLYFMFNLHSGVIPLECMNVGAVVITNDKQMPHPYIVNGYNGLIVLPTVKSIVNAVKAVASDNELRIKLVLNGYRTIDGIVSSEQRLWDEFYKELTNKQFI